MLGPGWYCFNNTEFDIFGGVNADNKLGVGF
jgi:hypothetical protein